MTSCILCNSAEGKCCIRVWIGLLPFLQHDDGHEQETLDAFLDLLQKILRFYHGKLMVSDDNTMAV